MLHEDGRRHAAHTAGDGGDGLDDRLDLGIDRVARNGAQTGPRAFGLFSSQLMETSMTT